MLPPDRVWFATATTGTAAFAIGAALPLYRTPSQAALTDGAVTSYVVQDGTDWELGVGTYSATGQTITRTLRASSTGALLNLSGGATVFLTASSLDLSNPELTALSAGGTSRR